MLIFFARYELGLFRDSQCSDKIEPVIPISSLHQPAAVSGGGESPAILFDGDTWLNTNCGEGFGDCRAWLSRCCSRMGEEDVNGESLCICEPGDAFIGAVLEDDDKVSCVRVWQHMDLQRDKVIFFLLRKNLSTLEFLMIRSKIPFFIPPALN